MFIKYYYVKFTILIQAVLIQAEHWAWLFGKHVLEKHHSLNVLAYFFKMFSHFSSDDHVFLS